MLSSKIALAALMALGLSIAAAPKASASPEFLAYEGKNAIHEGQGGEKKTVDGVDFWFDGDPPHRFQVLGAISDRRMSTGLYGAIRMSNLDRDIAKTAKQAGGDAVVLEREGEDLIGESGFGSAYASGGRGWASGFGSSYAAPVEAHVSRYIVVKYLPDDLPPPPAAPPPTNGAVP